MAHELLGAITQQPTPSASSSSFPWRLDTKYYTADVEFDVRHVDHCDHVQLEEGAYEAVLLTFDAAERSSFESLQRWWEGAGGAAADLGVRLAVGTGAGPARQAWLQEVEEWCAGQLVEYVETGQADGELAEAPGGAAAAPGIDSSRRQGEEAQGVRRIVEALQAHMWPGMLLKPSPRHGAAGVGTAEQEEAEVEEEVVPAAPNGVLPAAANGLRSTSDGGGGAEEAEDFSFADYLQAPPAGSATAVAAAGGQQAAGSNGAGGPPAAGGQEEEVEVEQLERLFAQVASKYGRDSGLVLEEILKDACLPCTAAAWKAGEVSRIPVAVVVAADGTVQLVCTTCLMLNRTYLFPRSCAYRSLPHAQLCTLSSRCQFACCRAPSVPVQCRPPGTVGTAA